MILHCDRGVGAAVSVKAEWLTVMSNFLVSDVRARTADSRSIFQYIPYQRIGLFTAITDFALILVASITAGIVYHALLFDTEGDIESFVAVGSYSGLIFVLLSKLLGLYQPNTLLSASAQIRGVIIAWAVVLLLQLPCFSCSRAVQTIPVARRLVLASLVWEPSARRAGLPVLILTAHWRMARLRADA